MSHYSFNFTVIRSIVATKRFWSFPSLHCLTFQHIASRWDQTFTVFFSYLSAIHWMEIKQEPIILVSLTPSAWLFTCYAILVKVLSPLTKPFSFWQTFLAQAPSMYYNTYQHICSTLLGIFQGLIVSCLVLHCLEFYLDTVVHSDLGDPGINKNQTTRLKCLGWQLKKEYCYLISILTLSTVNVHV